LADDHELGAIADQVIELGCQRFAMGEFLFIAELELLELGIGEGGAAVAR
jgi:hypothetical protein